MNNHKFLIFILLCVSFISSGYVSCSSSKESEKNIENVQINKPVRITSVDFYNAYSSASSTNLNYNYNKIYDFIMLPYENSSVTYKVNITVFSLNEMKISNIKINDNLDFELLNYDYGSLCDEKSCISGVNVEIFIKIKYKEKSFNSQNVLHNLNLEFSFSSSNDVARIENNYYASLNDAVLDSKNHSTIFLLKNLSENIIIPSKKNITIDLSGFTIQNNSTIPVVENNGVLSLRNGTISSDTTKSTIYNNNTLIISDCKIYASKSQAVFNDGNLTILGNSELLGKSKNKATVQNSMNAKLVIKKAIISSLNFKATENAGNLIIGQKDGNINDKIQLIGQTYGLSSSSKFAFYGGIIKGENASISDETKLDKIEKNYSLFHEEEGNLKIARLAHVKTVYFSPNGGVVKQKSKQVLLNQEIGIMPTAEKRNLEFDGWYMERTFKTPVNEHTIITENTTLYAKYTRPGEKDLCKINNTYFKTIDSAINSIKNNVPTQITFIRHAKINIIIPKDKNVILNLNGFKLTNNTSSSIIINNGTLKVTSGFLTSNSNSSSVIKNNHTGNLVLEDVNINAQGKHQALYNNKGATSIMGESTLSAKTIKHATIHNLKGTLNIISATIYSKNNASILNDLGVLNLGIKDNCVNTTNPLIIGNSGITNNGTFNFYDGVIAGKINALDGNVSNIEDNFKLLNSTKEMDTTIYKSVYLTN